MLLPKRAPTNRTNIESSQRQYEAEQRRIQGMQQRRQEREFESRVVRSGPREERNALVYVYTTFQRINFQLNPCENCFM
jgi:hypothetical protein